MSWRFEHMVSEAATEIRLVGPGGSAAVDAWALEAPTELLAGVDLAQRLVASEGAIAEGDTLLIEHPTLAGLSIREAALLGLPPPADLRAVVEGTGLMTKPDFAVRMAWQTLSGQPVLGAERIGVWLRAGGRTQRLPGALFEISDVVARLDAVPPDDTGARLAAIAALRALLPAAEATGLASAKGMLGRITIVQADAFSLDLRGAGDAAKLIPILHRASDLGGSHLLPDFQQQAFGDDQFHRFGAARPHYTLGDGWIVVLSPPLRRALDHVRRVASAPLAARRALMRSPRALLREAVGDDVEETVLETLFQETEAWSDRVIGLGLWQPRVVPWIALPATEWFGPVGAGAGQRAPRQPQGLLIDGRHVPLTPAALLALQNQIMDAMGAGHPTVPLAVDGDVVSVPATHDTLAALQKVEAARIESPPGKPTSATAVEAVLPLTNESKLEIEADVAARPAPRALPPACLRTALKPHQREGLSWLQRAWTTGEPGVLLADDMGLGKTLQGLSFLAWLRDGMTNGVVPRAPLLIVAPTGLLENWRAEHDRHLSAPGLGVCVPAYGKGLRYLRGTGPDGSLGLDVTRLRNAEWVLTTYELLRDYDKDFCRVRFAALLFDETQKIKTPGVRLTDAAKAMNADFHIAMTGTPVENRLADLWCIIDTVHPGLLGDLRSFSADYERSPPDTDRLRRLRQSLDLQIGTRPPVILRRLKEESLPELPPCIQKIEETLMPPTQLSAYDAVLATARQTDRRGGALEALQALRALCLHPDPQGERSDGDFVAASARLQGAFRALDDSNAANEKVLLFLDDLDLQARLASLIQRRYRLKMPPMIINGQVDGPARQARVDRFQAAPEGFDVMILSPRAGGVGLTLTRANHVIHLARWWNPAVEDQCTGRALRIGQTRPVTVHIPMALLPDGRRSFDQNLQALLQRKRDLMREALLPPAATDADREELLFATLGGGGVRREP